MIIVLARQGSNIFCTVYLIPVLAIKAGSKYLQCALSLFLQGRVQVSAVCMIPVLARQGSSICCVHDPCPSKAGFKYSIYSVHDPCPSKAGFKYLQCA